MAWNGFLDDKLKQRQYQYQSEAKKDILAATTSYGDLHPEEIVYASNETSKQITILCLTGTIPVSYKGSSYNIPIRIGLLHGYPHQAPLVHVKPTGTMEIKPNRHVDHKGNVYLPLLTEWQKRTKSNLIELIIQLQVIFGQVPPVYTKPAQPPTSTQPVYSNQYSVGGRSSSPWQDFLTNTYPYQTEAKKDILNAITSYNDLHPEESVYVSNETGKQTTILCLNGTIPVNYKGSSYNIPIFIQMLQGYPHQSPLVYVKPTSTMAIKPNRNVDHNGKVYLPILTDWDKQGKKSDLIDLIQQLQVVFGQVPPVYSKSAQPPPQHQSVDHNPYPTTPYPTTPYPATPYSTTPYPAHAAYIRSTLDAIGANANQYPAAINITPDLSTSIQSELSSHQASFLEEQMVQMLLITTADDEDREKSSNNVKDITTADDEDREKSSNNVKDMPDF